LRGHRPESNGNRDGKHHHQFRGRPGFRHQEEITTLKDTYNLIVANLTAKLLIKLKKTLTSLLRPGGYLVLSGIIDQNQSDIEAHFFREPLKLSSSLSEKEWVCYVLKKETNQP